MIYKHGNSWYCKFKFKGEPIRFNTHAGTKAKAETIERRRRDELAEGIHAPKEVPTLTQFGQQFIDYLQTNHAHDATVNFYAARINALCRVLGSKRIDQ